MATDGGSASISKTSKPRGNYLDPLKACALSGESNVPAGKSESATFSKFTNLTRQTRRNAGRASVLNDVERSRYNSVVKRIENEKHYTVSVLDRQYRDFQKSLRTLEKQRKCVSVYSKEFLSSNSFRAYMGLPVIVREIEIPTITLPPIDEHQKELEREAKEKEEYETAKRERDMKLLADADLPEYPRIRTQTMPAIDRKPGFIANGMPQLPGRFYSGMSEENIAQDNIPDIHDQPARSYTQ